MLYFAYGSNMDPMRMQERGIRWTGRKPAVLERYRLSFSKIALYSKGAGAATIVPDGKAVVEGVLYDISDSDLQRLDEYEGFPDQYDRIQVRLLTGEGTVVEAVTYMAQPHRIREGLRPTASYLQHLLAARDTMSELNYQTIANQPIMEDA